jgi:hypothetical protein
MSYGWTEPTAGNGWKGGADMNYTQDDLNEAKRQIASTIHKLRETIRTLEAKEDPARYKSQITLAKRRVKAFELANVLIEREINAG